MTVTPFASIRQSEVSRDAYSEDATATVTFPISYDKFSQKITTAILGARLGVAISENVKMRARAGVEYDIDEKTTGFPALVPCLV